MEGLAATEPEATPVAQDFEQFYRDEFSRANRLAYVLVQDASLAEDIAQEGFTAVARGWNEIDNPRGYLRTVLVNVAGRYRVREHRQRDLVAAGETAVLSDETFEMMDLIGRLPARQRNVIVLRYFEDLSELAIAQTLECRPGTVKSLASRALKELRKELEK